MLAMSDAASWGGKRNNVRRLGGMSDALSLAADLGMCTQPVLDESGQEGVPIAPGSGDSLVRVLRELTSIQRNLVNLQVELQGRQEDERVAHLTHVREIEKKTSALAKTTATLKDVIQNKDRVIARLQQPYSLDCIPVETEYQKHFSELLVKAAGDYGALSAAMGDLQWSANFKDPPAVWGELLRPIPAALASCTRYYEALSAMREAVAQMCKLRAIKPLTPVKIGWSSPRPEPDCTTPQWTRETVIAEEPSSDDLIIRSRRHASQIQQPRDEQEWRTVTEASLTGDPGLDGTKIRRMSWPPSPVTPVASGVTGALTQQNH